MSRRRDYAAPDHPRRCGENYDISNIALAIIGSPPQVRGKHPCCTDALARPRITPAGAGKTASRAADGSLKFNHPRRCGENGLHCQKVTPIMGSPPQVRGKRWFAGISVVTGYITPAGAGKTQVLRQSSGRHSDHPRRCGENDVPKLTRILDTGSPPQVRGKLGLNAVLFFS